MLISILVAWMACYVGIKNILFWIVWGVFAFYNLLPFVAEVVELISEIKKAWKDKN